MINNPQYQSSFDKFNLLYMSRAGIPSSKNLNLKRLSNKFVFTATFRFFEIIQENPEKAFLKILKDIEILRLVGQKS